MIKLVINFKHLKLWRNLECSRLFYPSKLWIVDSTRMTKQENELVFEKNMSNMKSVLINSITSSALELSSTLFPVTK